MKTAKEKLNYAKTAARELGCILKEQPTLIDGMKAYQFIVRETGEWVIRNMTLSVAVLNLQSGRLADLVEAN